jgi:hypothetical protein
MIFTSTLESIENRQSPCSDHEQDATPLSTAVPEQSHQMEPAEGRRRSAKEKKARAAQKVGQRLMLLPIPKFPYITRSLTLLNAPTCCSQSSNAVVCSTDFDSKNQLFAPIDEPGHTAAAVPAAKGSKQTASTSMHDVLISSDEDSRRGRGNKGDKKRKLD